MIIPHLALSCQKETMHICALQPPLDHPVKHLWSTHHIDLEGVKEIKGQCGQEIQHKPACQIVQENGMRVKHHLTRFADKSGAEIQHNIWNKKE